MKYINAHPVAGITYGDKHHEDDPIPASLFVFMLKDAESWMTTLDTPEARKKIQEAGY